MRCSKIIRIVVFTDVIAVLLLAMQACQPSQRTYIKNTGEVFGTEYHITYCYHDDIQKEIEFQLQKVNNSLSTFNPKSTLSLINQNKSTTMDTMTARVIRLALQVSHHTQGAFDITVAPLVNAWGFGFRNAENISKSLIDSIMQNVGYTQITISGNKIVKKRKTILLDCSGIAKGYACDVVAAYLESLGIHDYLIEIGGEIKAGGNNPENKKWTIGISNPIEDSIYTENQQTVSVIQATDIGLATSGNYRNFYYKNGKKYAHTIDPHTGYPVQHELLSSTVIAPTCAEADAYATAFMVMGMSKARKILQQQPQLQAYFIYSNKDGKLSTWHTPHINILQ